MSFRGRGGGGGGGRGGFRGGRGGFSRGRGRGGGSFNQYDQGPPEEVVELGTMMHPCEGELVCKCTNEKVPYFNAPVFLENKSQIGKVDEIFGPMNDFYFSVKLSPNMGADSFNKLQKFFCDPGRLLPMARFLSGNQRGGRGGRGGGRGGPRGGGRGFGGRGGGFGGGRGGGFGGGRGGFSPRGGGGRGFSPRGGRGGFSR
eukprot:scpid97158/ scgid8814/ H/ACA ribonucleoprotein complex subunit 1; Nucleolar protein family A member 1; snoRNP protein GAR1